MENQLVLNILISLIIGVSISYYYLQKINTKFFTYSITIFSLSFVIFYCLGPKNTIESFHNDEECPPCNNHTNNEDNELGEDNTTNEENYLSQNSEESSALNEESSVLNEESDILNEEEYNQEELLNTQEEYIKNVIDEEEIEEEDNNDELKKKIAKKKMLESNLFNKVISGNNNQFNPGIGVGISPVNIYINGDQVEVDKFKNNKEKSHKNKENNSEKCDDNYFKKASRIYNNCDWIKDKKDWCDGTYNYDKNCNNNNLLPTQKTEVTKIPQTLNNLVNTKKTDKNSEPCPLDTNKPWSIYKTGDDKENEIIPEGFNL